MSMTRPKDLRLLSWNTQGQNWKALEARIKNYDIICVQECGNLVKVFGGLPAPHKLETIPDLGVHGGPEGYALSVYLWDRSGGAGAGGAGAGSGNLRCSLGIIYNTMRFRSVSVIESDDPMKRPVLCANGVSSGLYVYDIHAGGVDYIDEAVAIAARNSKWVVAGDFNQSPSSLAPIAAKAHGHVLYDGAEGPTRPASKAVIDNSISNLKGTATLPTFYGGSDHRPVECTFAL